jgi:mono/diheme cytochrome c family protein
MTARTAFVPLAVALVAAGCRSTPRLPERPDGAPVLEIRGALEGKPTKFTLGDADLARLPQRSVRGTDPATGRTATWSGVDLMALAERVRTKPWVDTMVVRTADGRAAPLPAGVVRQHRPVLADHVDGAPLPARIVAWPTVEQPGLERDARLPGWWAAAPVALEFDSWQRTYARKLGAPAGSVEAARPGAGLFVQRCVVCHAVRGAGGKKGPDLSTWASGHDAAALQGVLAHHPGRTAADLDQDLVPPVYAYLDSIARAPPPAEEPASKKPDEKAAEGGEEGERPPGQPPRR